MQERFGLVFNRGVDGEAEIAKALGLKANGIGVDVESLQRLAELERGAVEDGGIEGADAKVPSGLDHGNDVLFDVDEAAAGSGAKAETVAAEDELIGEDVS